MDFGRGEGGEIRRREAAADALWREYARRLRVERENRRLHERLAVLEERARKHEEELDRIRKGVKPFMDLYELVKGADRRLIGCWLYGKQHSLGADDVRALWRAHDS